MEQLALTLRSLISRFGAATILVLLSQGISAFSLFLLPLLGLKVSDIYALALQIGTGPFNGLVMGVIYLLAIGRPNFAAWHASRMLILVFTVILTIIAFLLFRHRAETYGLSLFEIIEITVAFGIGGFALALAGLRGVQLACMGRPWLLAGITILPNLGMALTTAMIVTFAKHSAAAPVLPAASWMAINVLVCVGALLHPLPQIDPGTRGIDGEDAPRNKGLHAIGLLIGVVTSTVLPLGFVSAVAALSTGAATALFLASRIGSALIGVLINSVLLVQHNWSGTTKSIGRYSSRMMTFAFACGCLAVLLHMVGVANLISYALVVVAWLGFLSAAPVVLRAANVRRLGSVILMKSGVDVIITSIALLVLFRLPTVTGYFAIYMLSQCVTCLICGRALGDRLLAWTSGGSLALAALLLFGGW